MKLSKVQLKKILKEVVRELVNEGAFDKVVKESVAPRVASGGNRRPAANDFANSYGQTEDEDTSSQSSLGQASPNTRLQEVTRRAALEASGGDAKQAKMMEAIFADTAQTTLQNMIGAEGGGGGAYTGERVDPEQERQEMATLDALSGGKGAQHWAALAFGKYSKE